MVLQALEDKVLALFATTGAVTILATFLEGQSDPKYVAVGVLLIAVGGILKAFLSPSKPAPAPVQ